MPLSFFVNRHGVSRVVLKLALLFLAGVAVLPGQATGLARAHHTIDSLAASIPGRVGAAAMVVETGDLVMSHGNERFPMQSVAKVPVAMAVLQRIDTGEVKLSQEIHVRKQDMVPSVQSLIRDRSPNGTSLTVRELLRAAIVESDGTASDILLILVPLRDVDQMVHKLGADSMKIVATERAMAANPTVQYKNWSTPLAAVKLLRALQQGRGISAPSRVLLTAWLTETSIGEKRINALLPPGTAVAYKCGTDATRQGLTRATNDIGVVSLPNGQHLAIAVFVLDSKATEAQREATIALALWDAARK
jgi:beta-lactamase class A